jgi:hypothetical protein
VYLVLLYIVTLIIISLLLTLYSFQGAVISYTSHLVAALRCQFHIRLLLPVVWHGGDNEIRTHDPLLARQVLSQLSYTPIYIYLKVQINGL